MLATFLIFGGALLIIIIILLREFFYAKVRRLILDALWGNFDEIEEIEESINDFITKKKKPKNRIRGFKK